MNNYSLLIALFLFSFTFGQVQTDKLNTKKSEDVKIVERNIDIIGDPDALNDVLSVEAVPNIIQDDENKIYASSYIEVKPEFPRGNDKMFAFISKNFLLSEQMKEEQVKGKVFASFVIEKNGSISDVKVLRDFGYGSANETIRVLKMMPNWIPGKQNGKTVRCSYIFPIIIDATRK